MRKVGTRNTTITQLSLKGDESINITLNTTGNIENEEDGIVLERSEYIRVNGEPGWTLGMLELFKGGEGLNFNIEELEQDIDFGIISLKYRRLDEQGLVVGEVRNSRKRMEQESDAIGEGEQDGAYLD